MNEQKNKVKNWIKNHEKELLVTGAGIITIVIGIVCFHKRENIKDFCKNIKIKTNETSLDSITHEVVNNTNKLELNNVNCLPENDIIKDLPKRKKPDEPFDVTRHIRNLHEGQKPSDEKIKSALEYGIKLELGQTWVDYYEKNKLNV